MSEPTSEWGKDLKAEFKDLRQELDARLDKLRDEFNAEIGRSGEKTRTTFKDDLEKRLEEARQDILAQIEQFRQTSEQSAAEVREGFSAQAQWLVEELDSRAERLRQDFASALDHVRNLTEDLSRDAQQAREQLQGLSKSADGIRYELKIMGRTAKVVGRVRKNLQALDRTVAAAETTFATFQARVDEWIKNAGRIAAAAWSVAIALLLMGIGGLIWSGRISQKVDDLAVDVTATKADVSGLKADVSGLKADVSGIKNSVDKILQSIQGAQEKEARRKELQDAVDKALSGQRRTDEPVKHQEKEESAAPIPPGPTPKTVPPLPSPILLYWFPRVDSFRKSEASLPPSITYMLEYSTVHMGDLREQLGPGLYREVKDFDEETRRVFQARRATLRPRGRLLQNGPSPDWIHVSVRNNGFSIYLYFHKANDRDQYHKELADYFGKEPTSAMPIELSFH